MLLTFNNAVNGQFGNKQATSNSMFGRVESITDEDSLPVHNMCEPITINLCKDLAYDRTIMPNILGHERQEDAGLEAHQFFPLVKYNCSPELHFFLCSVYLPPCTILPHPLPPCRPKCLAAKTGCEKIMNQFGFQWPEKLNCDNFPMDQDEEMCIGEQMTSSTPVSREIVGMDFQCPTHFQIPSSMEYQLQVGDAVVENCGAPCDGMFFTEEDTSFSRAILAIVGGVCIVPTLFTVITFLLDMQRFQYPERPIIFMSLCYLFISCCYVIGYFQGTSIACGEAFAPPTAELSGEGHRMISPITQGVHNQMCTIMFMVVYMFTMAAAIW